MGAFAQCSTASRPGATQTRRIWTETADASASSRDLLLGEVYKGGVLLDRFDAVLGRWLRTRNPGWRR